MNEVLLADILANAADEKLIEYNGETYQLEVFSEGSKIVIFAQNVEEDESLEYHAFIEDSMV